MRESILTIPINEVFEPREGCPICAMRNTVEEHISEYIMGAAMMEPDVRIETNRLGFCHTHFNSLLKQNNRLSLGLMINTYLQSARANVFENRKAESFYMPKEQKCAIIARDKIKIAVCATPVAEKTEPQVLREDHVVLKLLGAVPYQRETSFIIDGNSNAKVLTIGEAYTTEGNWAGFPPHKHDVNDMPNECVAEEIYYFLFDPCQGFAVQCLYTADGEVDEAYRVKNDELVEFPYGYHTTVSTPGYKTYFLWFMAGDYQGFNRSSDPEHKWIENR